MQSTVGLTLPRQISTLPRAFYPGRSRHNLLDDVAAFRIRLGRDQRADGEATQGIADGKRRFCGIFPTRERQRIRPALALSIQVDPADLVCQGINEFDELVRITAEQADLLAVIGLSYIVQE